MLCNVSWEKKTYLGEVVSEDGLPSSNTGSDIQVLKEDDLLSYETLDVRSWVAVVVLPVT